jgi:hypothetical protein
MLPGPTDHRESIRFKHIFGKKRIDYANDELVVVSLVKNAEIYIQSFVEHYIRLGVKHIVILDNGSSDYTIDIAATWLQVSGLSCDLPFRNYNLLMRQQLIQRFEKKNRWVLCVDIDEFFDYPYSDQISLNALLRYLTNEKYTTMVAYMLDMFSDQAISDINYSNGNIREKFPYYDISSILCM